MVWELETGTAIATRKPELFERVAFSPDRTMFATGSQDQRVRLYDMSNGEIVSTFEGHAHTVSSLLFSPDGKTLASGSYDGTILLWDLTPDRVSRPPDLDYDDNGAVGFGDFIELASRFGLRKGDLGYHVRYDLDGNGMIGSGDFVIFAKNFG